MSVSLYVSGLSSGAPQYCRCKHLASDAQMLVFYWKVLLVTTQRCQVSFAGSVPDSVVFL